MPHLHYRDDPAADDAEWRNMHGTGAPAVPSSTTSGAAPKKTASHSKSSKHPHARSVSEAPSSSSDDIVSAVHSMLDAAAPGSTSLPSADLATREAGLSGLDRVVSFFDSLGHKSKGHKGRSLPALAPTLLVGRATVVASGPLSDKNVKTTVIIGFIVAIALSVIVAALLCCCCRRWKKKKAQGGPPMGP